MLRPQEVVPGQPSTSTLPHLLTPPPQHPPGVHFLSFPSCLLLELKRLHTGFKNSTFSRCLVKTERETVKQSVKPAGSCFLFLQEGSGWQNTQPSSLEARRTSRTILGLSYCPPYPCPSPLFLPSSPFLPSPPLRMVIQDSTAPHSGSSLVPRVLYPMSVD